MGIAHLGVDGSHVEVFEKHFFPGGHKVVKGFDIGSEAGHAGREKVTGDLEVLDLPAGIIGDGKIRHHHPAEAGLVPFIAEARGLHGFFFRRRGRGRGY